MKGLKKILEKVDKLDEYYLIKWETWAFVLVVMGVITIILCQ